MTDETKTYTVNVACSNCGYTGHAEVEKGRKFGGSLFFGEECPRCECDTLRSSNRPTLGGAR